MAAQKVKGKLVTPANEGISGATIRFISTSSDIAGGTVKGAMSTFTTEEAKCSGWEDNGSCTDNSSATYSVCISNGGEWTPTHTEKDECLDANLVWDEDDVGGDYDQNIIFGTYTVEFKQTGKDKYVLLGSTELKEDLDAYNVQVVKTLQALNIK